MKPSSDLPPLTDGKTVERVEKQSLTPLFDSTNHEHEYVRDEEEEDGYYAEMCLHCPVGRLVAK